MNKAAERLYNGLVKENPTFVLMLGMCPTLAVTTLAVNGIGMGLTTTVILALSNVMISALRKVIPDGVRMPAYIVIVASFVTIVQFLLQAYLPNLYAFSRYLYPADRRKLHHPGQSRGLRFEKSCNSRPFLTDWAWDLALPWVSLPHRYRSGAHRFR